VIAFLKYRKVVNECSGPITQITTWQENHPDLGLFHDAVAFLDKGLCPPRNTEIYAHGVGGGASRIKIIAVHKSISEALERWAYYDLMYTSPAHQDHTGLSVDPTTTGFACHPSPLLRNVRQKARNEAIERWAVFNWWMNNLPARLIYKDEFKLQFEITTPFNDAVVVVCAEKSISGRYVYGFSAASNFLLALQQALIEQHRNKHSLDKLDEKFQPVHLADRRLTYFSSQDGFQNFFENFERSTRLYTVPDAPRKIIDKEIRGPWSKFAHVWRVLYEGGETWQTLSEKKIFIF